MTLQLPNEAKASLLYDGQAKVARVAGLFETIAPEMILKADGSSR